MKIYGTDGCLVAHGTTNDNSSSGTRHFSGFGRDVQRKSLILLKQTLWTTMLQEREPPASYSLDYLRVLACLMVIATHCCEPFYIESRRHLAMRLGKRPYMASASSTVPCRGAVPLFIMTSSTCRAPEGFDNRLSLQTQAFRQGVRPLCRMVVHLRLLACPDGTDGRVGTSMHLLHPIWNFNGDSGHPWYILHAHPLSTLHARPLSAQTKLAKKSG